MVTFHISWDIHTYLHILISVCYYHFLHTSHTSYWLHSSSSVSFLASCTPHVICSSDAPRWASAIMRLTPRSARYSLLILLWASPILPYLLRRRHRHAACLCRCRRPSSPLSLTVLAHTDTVLCHFTSLTLSALLHTSLPFTCIYFT